MRGFFMAAPACTRAAESITWQQKRPKQGRQQALQKRQRLERLQAQQQVPEQQVQLLLLFYRKRTKQQQR